MPEGLRVTLVTQERACLFGDIVNDEMPLTEAGRIVAEEWQKLLARFPHLTPDVSVVMPNHLYGIIAVVGKGEASASNEPGRPQTLAADASPPTARPDGC